MTEPVEGDPNTWQCCSCDGLTDEDTVDTLTWDAKTTIVCPKCGHAMTWACCSPPNPWKPKDWTPDADGE